MINDADNHQLIQEHLFNKLKIIDIIKTHTNSEDKFNQSFGSFGDEIFINHIIESDMDVNEDEILSLYFNKRSDQKTEETNKNQNITETEELEKKKKKIDFKDNSEIDINLNMNDASP